MTDKIEVSLSKWRAALERVAFVLFAPTSGLVVTWFALTLVVGATFGSLAGRTLLMVGPTLVLMLMLAVAAYMPPTKPFREVSTLAARVADLVKVASGAALFGAAAAYSGGVGSIMSRMPMDEVLSPAVVWDIIWPILLAATMIGASVVGVRLGWDFRRSGHRARLLALGRLRSWLPDLRMKRHPVIDWFASIVVTGSHSGAFMLVGYFAPVIILGDVYLVMEYAETIG